LREKARRSEKIYDFDERVHSMIADAQTKHTRSILSRRQHEDAVSLSSTGGNFDPIDPESKRLYLEIG
jgi:hypothetical protein